MDDSSFPTTAISSGMTETAQLIRLGLIAHRNGQPLTPLANALFPGDLVTFSVGDRVPADIRLIEAVSLEIDESALTGETRPARKNTDVCGLGEGEDTHGEGGGKALGERHCMAFMGTLVRSGNSRVAVMRSERLSVQVTGLVSSLARAKTRSLA